eukprot:Plantae.Rhodophyta-Hildenbrandia_rubra.ctg3030.p1 GENE.Plantae.Rhodophyta-Hildenbrandia_rubra.ctg3030~~Plantae.Rhodophyta-Hildenbrandia_rubra.ctg3030.p1  ORF type:complete len:560 (+),score=117.62 Plantae.Rhodophyta-Hildenbrandia_rubra.ctg3030:3852-5531(+)
MTSLPNTESSSVSPSPSASPSTSQRLQDLEREQVILKPLQSAVPNAWTILEAEIQRLRQSRPDILPGATTSNANNPTGSVSTGSNHHGVVTQHQTGGSGRARTKKRIRIDIDDGKAPPGYNYVGRILGPRGATLKTLEKETGCRIMIRGRGSIRKDKEEEMRGKPGWEHVFEEKLHIVCEVGDDMDEMSQLRALKRAKEAVQLLLIPVPDEKDSLKRQQLRDLAILNGTYRHPHHNHGGFNGGNSRHHPPTPSLVGINAGLAISPAHLAQSMQANRTSLVHNNHGVQMSHHPHMQQATFQLNPVANTMSSAPMDSSNVANGFGNINLSSPPHQQKSSPLQPQSRASNLRLPNFPPLDLEGLNDPSMRPMTPLAGMNPMQVPLASPTIVDPELYPFPPTPAPGASTDKGFGSPIWSSPGLPRSSSATAGPGTPSATTAAGFSGAGRDGTPSSRSANFARSASFGTPSGGRPAGIEELVGTKNSSHLDGEPVRRLKASDRSLSSGAKLPRGGSAVGDSSLSRQPSNGSTTSAAFDSLFPNVVGLSRESRYRRSNGRSRDPK